MEYINPFPDNVSLYKELAGNLRSVPSGIQSPGENAVEIEKKDENDGNEGNRDEGRMRKGVEKHTEERVR